LSTSGTDTGTDTGTDGGSAIRRRRLRLGGGVAAAAVVAAAGFVLIDDDGGAQVPIATAASDTGAADPAETADERRAREEAEERAEEDRRAADEERRAAEEAAEAEAAEAARLAAEEAEAAEAARQAEEAAEAERRAEQEAAEAAAEAERQAAAEQQERVDAQQRLIDLGYLVGAADGQFGQQTSSALMAFQAVQGLSVDGQLGPQTIAALASPAEPTLRGGPATRIEVDMDRQVLHLVEGGQRVTTMKVSTGRGGTFESQDGQTLRAETPVGTFTIDRRIAGEKPSSYGIGSMWDPMYFHGPWAIHGSPNVPAGPASAGCVRVALADGRWLFDRVPNGTHVVLYGGTHVFTP
jgi:lipoprotein-anchoring transpeptidase ErfK/SrfK